MTVAHALKVGVIGAGSIGLGVAAKLAADGHAVALWAHAASATLAPFPIDASGALSYKCFVQASATLADVVGAADILMLCVPAHAHMEVLDALAPLLRDGHVVIVSAQYSLSAYYLSKLLSKRPSRPDVSIGALATTVLSARRRGPGEVQVMTIREHFDLGVLPSKSSAAVPAMFEALFGARFSMVPMASIVFSNPNPVAHGPVALGNFTRIENGEVWSNYGLMTPGVSRLIERVDGERCAAARAFGVETPTLMTHVHNSFGTPLGSFADMAAHIYRTRGGPNGPQDLSTRYVTEDIPFGLFPVALLGKLAGEKMDIHDALVSIFGGLYGRDFKSENRLIVALDLEGESFSVVQQRLATGW